MLVTLICPKKFKLINSTIDAILLFNWPDRRSQSFCSLISIYANKWREVWPIDPPTSPKTIAWGAENVASGHTTLTPQGRFICYLRKASQQGVTLTDHKMRVKNWAVSAKGQLKFLMFTADWEVSVKRGLSKKSYIKCNLLEVIKT